MAAVIRIYNKIITIQIQTLEKNEMLRVCYGYPLRDVLREALNGKGITIVHPVHMHKLKKDFAQIFGCKPVPNWRICFA